MTVGYQGEPGAFSEAAALALLGDVETRGFVTFDDVVDAVESGEVDTGLLPCENTIYGSIARTYDLLLQHPTLHIVDETTHRIVQCLVGVHGATLETIRVVASHPVTLEQCRGFFRKNPQLRAEIVEDTAGAVREIVGRSDPHRAAVGSAPAAQRYGGSVIAENIADEAENVTRFFLVSRDSKPRQNLGRACLAIVLPHEPGSLHRALGEIAARGYNLRSLIARPRQARPFEYVFYLEIDIGPGTAGALASTSGRESRILGNY